MIAMDPYYATCPSRLVLDRIADKWTMLVLGLLENEPVRFNELKRRVDGISQKMLSQTLKALERDGLVVRRAYPTVPVTVEYVATDMGRNLNGVLASLRDWAAQHAPNVLQSQATFDRMSATQKPRKLISI